MAKQKQAEGANMDMDMYIAKQGSYDTVQWK